jgi:hypothetical protein
MPHEYNENQSESRQTQDASNSAQGDQASTVERTSSRKIASPARVAANRRNAQKSTGPTTSEGKNRSRWNALQHGLLAKRLFTRDESERATFDHLLESLHGDWQPEGALEQILLEKIAVGYHKLSTVYGYEAEFAKTPAEFFLSIDRTGRYATSINRQITQDLNQLERLQRQRKGEFVPAPISLDVTISGLEAVDALSTVRNYSAIGEPVLTSADSVATIALPLMAVNVQLEGNASLEVIAQATEEALETRDVPSSPQMHE